MIIYIVYQKFYADFENGLDDEVYIECGYKNKRKAVKKAKELMNHAKSNHLYIDEDIRNKRNPFKIIIGWIYIKKKMSKKKELVAL